MSESIPKAVLYHSPDSVWSLSARLALEEKGYGEDEIDLRIVDLTKGENFGPSFLRLNDKATVPTLIVPLERTLSHDVDTRYKAISNPKTLVEFLDKSRSTMSRTHTTSTAPAPSLAPATIAYSAKSQEISELLFSDLTSPDALLFSNAWDEASLRALAKEVVPFLQGRKAALHSFSEDAGNQKITVSEKVKAFWTLNEVATQNLLEIFLDADKADDNVSSEGKKRREEYFANARDIWQKSLRTVLVRLDQEIIGPFVLGDQFSIADLYLAPWLARLAELSGSVAKDDGNSVVRKIEERVGNGLAFAKTFSPSGGVRKDDTVKQAKLAALWDAIKARSSWQKVYGSIA